MKLVQAGWRAQRKVTGGGYVGQEISGISEALNVWNHGWNGILYKLETAKVTEDQDQKMEVAEMNMLKFL